MKCKLCNKNAKFFVIFLDGDRAYLCEQHFIYIHEEDEIQYYKISK
jgi:hypothetical protein